MAISFAELGYSAAPALGIIVLLIPLQIYLGRLKSKVGFENTMTTSKRVHIMSEILTAIKLIKFYAWEQPFYERICDIRKRELELLRNNLIANSINFMVVFCVPVLCTLFSLLTFWKTGNIINPIIGFTVVSVFNTLRYPLLMAPLAINSFSNATTALKRLDEFFAHEEIEPAVRYPLPNDSDITISLVRRFVLFPNYTTFQTCKKLSLFPQSLIISLKYLKMRTRLPNCNTRFIFNQASQGQNLI